jgi:hypothetical protein
MLLGPAHGQLPIRERRGLAAADEVWIGNVAAFHSMRLQHQGDCH